MTDIAELSTHRDGIGGHLVLRSRPEASVLGDAGPRYALPPLPFPIDALEPHCPAEAVAVHHACHHAAHVDGANQAVARLAEARFDRRWARISRLDDELAFHVSGHALHSIMWTNLIPHDRRVPGGEFADMIDRNFGNLDTFRNQFTRAGLSIRGSGWVALSWEPLGRRLVIEQIHNNQAGASNGSIPLLVCDVWEHAYAPRFAHARVEWIETFWSLVNWPDVETRLACAEPHEGQWLVPFGWPDAARRMVG